MNVNRFRTNLIEIYHGTRTKQPAQMRAVLFVCRGSKI